MEKIAINPENVYVEGNLIGDDLGYLQDNTTFQNHKCELSLNDMKLKEWDNFNVYSFRIKANGSLVNMFNEEVAYCNPVNVSSAGSWLYVCEHFDEDFNPAHDIYDVNTFDNGIKLTIKDEYLTGNTDNTNPFYLLILQDNTGVPIPANTNSILFSTTFDASPDITNINVGFVYFDAEGNLLSNILVSEIHNESTGNKGRCNVYSENIPTGAKYVGIEFQFGDGVFEDDYFSIELNCLLFNSTYGGFVRND